MSSQTFTSGGNLVSDERLQPPPRFVESGSRDPFEQARAFAENFRAASNWMFQFYNAVRVTNTEDLNPIFVNILQRLEVLEPAVAELQQAALLLDARLDAIEAQFAVMAALTDPAGGGTVDAEARTVIGQIIDAHTLPS